MKNGQMGKKQRDWKKEDIDMATQAHLKAITPHRAAQDTATKHVQQHFIAPEKITLHKLAVSRTYR